MSAIRKVYSLFLFAVFGGLMALLQPVLTWTTVTFHPSATHFHSQHPHTPVFQADLAAENGERLLVEAIDFEEESESDCSDTDSKHFAFFTTVTLATNVPRCCCPDIGSGLTASNRACLAAADFPLYLRVRSLRI